MVITVISGDTVRLVLRTLFTVLNFGIVVSACLAEFESSYLFGLNCSHSHILVGLNQTRSRVGLQCNFF